MKDLLVSRYNAKAVHVVQAIGSSSIEKGKTFIETNMKGVDPPTIYDSYDGVYADKNVDIVYIGTPHTMHKQNCLDAIHAGKNVLSEKPFTINERDAQEVITAAKAKGVFLMEGKFT